MGCYVLQLQEVDRTQFAVVGGKGALLGELARIEGIRVPDGFCVTADAFRRALTAVPSLKDRLDRLSHLQPQDRDATAALAVEIRRAVEAAEIPDDLAAAITGRLAERAAYAVRSSATAEDLPGASFAGQHDSYLNVVGPASILKHVSRCWASLFTERAVTYRLRNGFDHRQAQMAVVVQEMVFPEAAGVLFTADPVTANRKVTAVEAGFGLGEALVSGLVNPDAYKVRDGRIAAKAIGTKPLAIHAAPGGGTRPQPVAAERQEQPALTDAQVLRLAQLGRRIEAHFGAPQDIEWCLVDDRFQIVQSRPITTLFPVPVADDLENHVYVSVGHGQMMTDPIKPLGLSLFQLTALPRMYEAAGRLFVDVAGRLASPQTRALTLEALGKGDPLIGDALRTILDRGDFVQLLPDGDAGGGAPAASAVTGPAGGPPPPIATAATVVADLIARNEGSVATLKRDIASRSGQALLDFIIADIAELKRLLFEPLSHQVLMAGMRATWWLNDQMLAWLGEKNAADVLTRGVPGNVTSEMGLELLDVADVIRPYPDVVAFLERVKDDGFLDELSTLDGGLQARDAIATYLDKYGMRCVGEIDITRPRWSEQPTTLLPLLLSNVKKFEPGAGKRRVEEGRRQAVEKERELLARLRALPDGERKAGETKEMIDRIHAFTGYREYPKYGIVNRYLVYKQALLREAERLVRAGALDQREDIFYLTLQELQQSVAAGYVDRALIGARRDAFRAYQALTPPRVLTSDGEVIAGRYRRDDLPAGALVGLPVSAGTVEGRARVILDMAEAELEAGDILVTAHTDPSWAPLFVAVNGLVTEVGGLMTHGAVVAREYGLPAVVGVERATLLIRDGQRIRVNGTDGYVEVLDP
jgi:pyruvate,water dikinase